MKVDEAQDLTPEAEKVIDTLREVHKLALRDPVASSAEDRERIKRLVHAKLEKANEGKTGSIGAALEALPAAPRPRHRAKWIVGSALVAAGATFAAIFAPARVAPLAPTESDDDVTNKGIGTPPSQSRGAESGAAFEVSDPRKPVRLGPNTPCHTQADIRVAARTRHTDRPHISLVFCDAGGCSIKTSAIHDGKGKFDFHDSGPPGPRHGVLIFSATEPSATALDEIHRAVIKAGDQPLGGDDLRLDPDVPKVLLFWKVESDARH